MMNNSPAPLGSIPAVAALNLHKRFGETEVLRGVSLVANDHDVISIIGGSGSGKSTLLRCLNLLEIPDKGEIRIKDELLQIERDRSGAHPRYIRQLNRLRSRVGMVFQNFNLWAHRTVLENVTEAPIHVLGLPKAEALQRAEHYLQKVGIYGKKDEYPRTLSCGQKQRAAIARALCMEPQVMLFDEPTSALDPELVGEVLKVIRALADEGRTMILVTHEMRFAKDISDQVIFLEEGRIIEQGTPAQIFGAPYTEQCRRFLALSHDA